MGTFRYICPYIPVRKPKPWYQGWITGQRIRDFISLFYLTLWVLLMTETGRLNFVPGTQETTKVRMPAWIMTIINIVVWSLLILFFLYKKIMGETSWLSLFLVGIAGFFSIMVSITHEAHDFSKGQHRGTFSWFVTVMCFLPIIIVNTPFLYRHIVAFNKAQVGSKKSVGGGDTGTVE